VAGIVSNFNVVLLPEPTGGAFLVAVEDFSVVFGPNTTASALADLLSTRDQIEQSLRDNADRPTHAQLREFGRRIANMLLAGEVSDLYRSVGDARIQLTLSTIDQSLKRAPWEYVSWPGLPHGPHVERSIARIVPMAGVSRPKPRRLSGRALKVLLIGADVLGLEPIPWDETKSNLERIFGERLLMGPTAAGVQMTLLEGATRASMRKALSGQHYDIVHFLGHGQQTESFSEGRAGNNENYCQRRRSSQRSQTPDQR
jgi:hypothetical protein